MQGEIDSFHLGVMKPRKKVVHHQANSHYSHGQFPPRAQAIPEGPRPHIPGPILLPSPSPPHLPIVQHPPQIPYIQRQTPQFFGQDKLRMSLTFYNYSPGGGLRPYTYHVYDFMTPPVNPLQTPNPVQPTPHKHPAPAPIYPE